MEREPISLSEHTHHKNGRGNEHGFGTEHILTVLTSTLHFIGYDRRKYKILNQSEDILDSSSIR